MVAFALEGMTRMNFIPQPVCSNLWPPHGYKAGGQKKNGNSPKSTTVYSTVIALPTDAVVGMLQWGIPRYHFQTMVGGKGPLSLQIRPVPSICSSLYGLHLSSNSEQEEVCHLLFSSSSSSFLLLLPPLPLSLLLQLFSSSSSSFAQWGIFTISAK